MLIQLSKSKKMVTLIFSPDDSIFYKIKQIMENYKNNAAFAFRLFLDPSLPRQICVGIAKRLSSIDPDSDLKPVLEASFEEGQNKEKIKQNSSWEKEEILELHFNNDISFHNFMEGMIANFRKAHLDQVEMLKKGLATLGIHKVAESNENKASSKEQEKCSNIFSPQYVASQKKPVSASKTGYSVFKRMDDYMTQHLGKDFLEKYKDGFDAIPLFKEGVPVSIQFSITSRSEKKLEVSKKWFLDRFPDCTFVATGTSASGRLRMAVNIPIPKEVLDPEGTSAHSTPTITGMHSSNQDETKEPKSAKMHATSKGF